MFKLQWLFVAYATGSALLQKQPHVAIIGAGWGGYGAAKALAEMGCKITMIDTILDPTGIILT